MSLNTLTGGSFQDAFGNPLSLGYLTLELSHDELDTTTNSQICGGLIRTVYLDNTGNVAGSPTIENNDTLSPSASFYIVNAFKADGTKAWRAAQYLTVTSNTSPFNIGTGLTPSNPSSGGGSSSSGVLIEVNGVSAGSQSVLNLVAGSNTTITDGGAGSITFASTGGGGGGADTVTQVSTSQSITTSHLYLATGGAGGINLTLADATTVSGQTVRIVKVDSGVGSITLSTVSAQTINGQSSYVLINQWQYVQLESTATNWVVIANN